MADSVERKSIESEYESDADGASPWRWTVRRIEASDDDDDEGKVVKERFLWSSRCDESESEYDYEGELKYFEGGVVNGEELQEVSQEEKEEEEVQETVRFSKGKENKVMRPDFVPRHGSFYMHDDRFRSNRCYGRRRVSMIWKNLWDWTDEQKWKHDKFEDMTVQETDKIAPKTHHQHQRKNQSKGQSYKDTNQVGPLENFGNLNKKTSRIVKGRGPVKYRSIVESNNLNPSSKHQRSAKLKGSTSSSSSHGVSSHDLAMDSFPLSKSVTSCHLSTVKQPQSLPNVSLKKKNPAIFPLSVEFLQMGGNMVGYSFPTQQMYQSSIQSSDNRIPQPQMYPVIDESLITDAIQAGSFGLNFQLGGIPSLLPVMQLGALPYGAVDDRAPSMALVGYAPQPQQGSGNCWMTRYSKMR